MDDGCPVGGFSYGGIDHSGGTFDRAGFAFLFSSLMIAGVILTAGFSMFPFIMPSSLNPAQSLTMWDATSSQNTLTVMTFAAAIFVPIVLGYTIWTYVKMFGRVSSQFVERTSTQSTRRVLCGISHGFWACCWFVLSALSMRCG